MDARTLCLAAALGAAILLIPRTSRSADPADTSAKLDLLLQRLEALEDDNRQLRQELQGLRTAGARSVEPRPMPTGIDVPPPAPPAVAQPFPTETLYYGDEGRAFVTEEELRGWVADEVARQQTSTDPAPVQDFVAQQNARIAEIERGWKLFEKRAGEKKYPNVTVNGVFQADVGWFNQDPASLAQYGRIEDGADFRRFRISAKGSVTETVNYFAQVDFAFVGRPTFTDVWVEQTQVPILGNVRVGQWKQPFSLEVVSSFRYTTFMERSVLFQPFTTFRRLGVGFYDHSEDESMTWAASVFRSGQDQYGGTLATDGGWGTAERITWLPYWESNGEDYLHLGLGHFYNSPPKDSINFRTIPELFIGANANGIVGTSGQPIPGAQDGTPFFVATGPLNVSGFNVIGTELLWVRGPFSLQSETMVNFVNQGALNPAATLWGTYAQVGYFLTGEHRPYDRKAGAIDRVMPYENFKFSPCCDGNGWGAWEVAGRFSYIDLSDRNIAGGTMTDYTLGLNWYWNPFTKVVFNYVRANPNSPGFPSSHTNIFAMRMQVDF